MDDPLGAVTVVSEDGTPVVAFARGSGPAMLLVHGTAESDSFFKPLAALLESQFSLYLMQRRGRGKSGDSQTHSLQKEAGDVLGLLESIGEPVIVIGHGFGANCALEAAILSDSIAGVVLYEPRVDFPYTEGSIEAMEQLIEDGREEEVVLKFFAESDFTIEELMALREEPTWGNRFAYAHTVPRECRAEKDFDPKKFDKLTVRTLLLSGSRSSSAIANGAHVLSRVLTNARLEVLEGGGHRAISTEPRSVAPTVMAFGKGT
ncbi:MAG: alpha/beta fold hydrolase [Actinomycetota bacterium]